MRDPQSEHILIVEPDTDALLLIETYLNSAGFICMSALTGSDAIQIALKERPRLILIETQLPDQAGLAVFRRLRNYTRTMHIPFIFLASGREIILQNQILEAGAHDFIIKNPLDVQEIGLRIRNTLRRSRYESPLHPLTRLPTQEMIEQALAQSKGWQQTIMDIRLRAFDTFREIYGFMAADELLIFVSNVINDVVNEVGQAEDFAGHVGETDFMIVTEAGRDAPIRRALEERLSNRLAQFHSFIERDQGYVEVLDSSGQSQHKPLLHLEINTRPHKLA